MKIKNLKNTNTRGVLFIEATNERPLPDGNKGILGSNGILIQVINAHRPFAPKSGGVGDLAFIIITPKKEYFYAFDYSKDLQGWIYQIMRGAEILDIKIGQIREKQFQILNDSVYLLSDCEFEEYNFYTQDDFGSQVVNKNRRAVNKADVLSEKIL